MKRTALLALTTFFLSQGGAFAHEGEAHHEGHMADSQMQKLHHMMPMYSTTLPSLESAVEKGDTAAVEIEAGKILATIPDLKKSKPHKNPKQLKTFKKIAGGFESNLKETVEFAKKGDFQSAKESVKRVEASCSECHGKFR